MTSGNGRLNRDAPVMTDWVTGGPDRARTRDLRVNTPEVAGPS